MVIEFVLNGEKNRRDVDPGKSLLHFLREDMGLKGTKEGCGEGECGACSVLLDGKLVHSCLVPLIMVDGKEVLTIEGFSQTDRFRVLMESFAEEGAVQCGFCTPGMLLAAEALLRDNPNPGEDEIKDGISGNLCRCTGYVSIVRAIKRASIQGKGLW